MVGSLDGALNVSLLPLCSQDKKDITSANARSLPVFQFMQKTPDCWEALLGYLKTEHKDAALLALQALKEFRSIPLSEPERQKAAATEFMRQVRFGVVLGCRVGYFMDLSGFLK